MRSNRSEREDSLVSQDEVTALFIKLAKIDSPSGHEQEVADFLKKWLVNHGFSWKQDDVGNLYSIRQGDGDPLLFCGHMDTVQKVGQHVKPQIKDGLITSDGTTILGADDKAGIAAILTGVEKYLESSSTPRPIELLFTVREETGGGVEHLPADWIQSDGGYIFDIAKPLGLIATDGLHIVNFDVLIHGRDSHPSRPELGLNVSPKVASFINKFPQGDVANKGDTFINIGVVSFGTKDKVNTIPGEALIQGEVRSFNPIQFELWLSRMEKFVLTQLNKGGFKSEFSTNGYAPGYNVDKNDPVVVRAATVMKEMGFPVEYYRSSGVSDSNPLIAQLGKKVITLSDGISHPHNVEESIEQQSLVDMALVVIGLLNSR